MASPTAEDLLAFDSAFDRVVGRAPFWILLTVSGICILFAESLATHLSKTWTGPDSFYVNFELARKYTLKIYLLGGMSFFLALVQRVVLAITEMGKG